jgi:hypothetical protein
VSTEIRLFKLFFKREIANMKNAKAFFHGSLWHMGKNLFERLIGRDIAQSVSRRLPTTAARVRARVKSCGVCGWQSGTGVVVLRVIRLLVPSSLPIPSQSSSIIRGWYSRPIRSLSNSGLGSAPTQ